MVIIMIGMTSMELVRFLIKRVRLSHQHTVLNVQKVRSAPLQWEEIDPLQQVKQTVFRRALMELGLQITQHNAILQSLDGVQQQSKTCSKLAQLLNFLTEEIKFALRARKAMNVLS